MANRVNAQGTRKSKTNLFFFSVASIKGFERRMRCAVWDWGDRFTQPKQHLDEVVEYFHSIGGVPRWLQDGLNMSYAQVWSSIEIYRIYYICVYVHVRDTHTVG